MSKVRVFDLFDLYLGASGDAPSRVDFPSEDVRDRLFLEVVQGKAGLLVSVHEVVTTPRVGSYLLPVDGMAVRAVFWDGTPLSREARGELDAEDEAWRVEVGEPVGYVLGGENNRTVLVHPAPSRAGTLVVLYDDVREELPGWLENVVALEMVARHLERNHEHRDAEMGVLAQRVASLVSALVL